KTVKEATALAGIPISAIRSLGFDATCSLVVLDEQGQGLAVSSGGSANHDIIMWMDHRATVETAQINATKDPVLRYVGG
ncbi:sugar kinase, partial [Escherichia coli]